MAPLEPIAETVQAIDNLDQTTLSAIRGCGFQAGVRIADGRHGPIERPLTRWTDSTTKGGAMEQADLDGSLPGTAVGGAMEQVAFDGSQPSTNLGWYSYIVDQDMWSWSDPVYLLHGYSPGEVPADTAILLHHKHPDDRSRAAQVLDDAVRHGGPFSCYHRIIDRQEHVRSVLSVGRGIKDSTGQVERVEGYFVDLTDARRDETESEVRRALAGMAENRETIDLAKGMVMLATGCDPDTAFACLRRYSQNTNLKLHVVAQRLVSAGPAIGPQDGGVIAFLNDLAPSH